MADEESPEPPSITEVEITVGGHSIIVKAAAPLEEVAAQALGLYQQTQLAAQKIPFGFGSTASQVEMREQPDLAHHLIEPGGPEEE